MGLPEMKLFSRFWLAINRPGKLIRITWSHWYLPNPPTSSWWPAGEEEQVTQLHHMWSAFTGVVMWLTSSSRSAKPISLFDEVFFKLNSKSVSSCFQLHKTTRENTTDKNKLCVCRIWGSSWKKRRRKTSPIMKFTEKLLFKKTLSRRTWHVQTSTNPPLCHCTQVTVSTRSPQRPTS